MNCKIKISLFLFLSCVVGVSSSAFGQTELTTGVVMERMDPNDRAAYIAGIVEGLAYARFLRDGRQTAGMACINNWFYGHDGAIDQVYVAFGQFPDYPPGAVLSVLLDQVCG